MFRSIISFPFESTSSAVSNNLNLSLAGVFPRNRVFGSREIPFESTQAQCENALNERNESGKIDCDDMQDSCDNYVKCKK